MTIDIKKIDRSDWKPYRFDQIAESISERVEPQQTDLEIYVGLEHIDPETVHIKRWGSPKDVNGTKLKVYSGDVIFGKRRAYQRKAAIAEFEGICSAHAMVLRAKPGVIHPKMFPFFLHSDLFMHRAIDISVGSLSPTINWGTLKTQEFLLPPPEEQAKLAELLWAADEVVERYGEMEKELLTLKDVLRKDTFSNYLGKEMKIGSIVKLTAGGTPSTIKKEYWDNGTIRWMSSGDVHKKEIYDVDGRITELGLNNSSAKLLPKNSVVIALAGQGKTKGTVAITRVELCTNQSVAAFLPNEKINSDFLYHFLDSKYSDFREVTGDKNSRTGLNLSILKDVPIPDISLSTQIEIANKFKQIDDEINILAKTASTTQLLQRQLINQVFG